ncbi:ketopantoate reductase family protein [Candidatus Litorirhabdus singularis]|uniref:ketopantoate reductase family protein n=1 Tax=Candidatus Litorirhabdus singularis TaxID=2518993 RepID=UPI002432E6C0|nr:2-dehydropantoate 2-reductase [Candidatus Litorirhabdus singularis]
MTERWHILGAGAIGTLLATQLQEAGSKVSLLHRNCAGAEVAPAQLKRYAQGRVSTHHLTRSSAAAVQEIQGLIITTKAADVIPALLDVRGKLAADAPVILLHNGLGIYEQLINHYPASLTYCGITTEGAYLDNAGDLIHAGHGDTRVGQPDGAATARALSELLEPRGSWLWDADINLSLWRKLMINCAINPLTAIHGCRNGELLENPQLREETQALVAELAAVSAAAGFKQLAATLQKTVAGIIGATADNASSMRQDLERGRATEIEAITGYCCRRATTLNVPTPLNHRLLQQVRRISMEKN